MTIATTERAIRAARAVQHEADRRNVAALIDAWAARRIEALLFKGFHLAAFVYDEPAQRFYGDVDVLVHHTRADEARRIAVAHGWRTTVGSWAHRHLHTAFDGISSDLRTALDLHRFAIHSQRFGARIPRRITEAVLSDARRTTLAGGVVLVPNNVDALLVGLILQRSWGNGWQAKEADARDYALLQAAGATHTLLNARARELGCLRTLHLYERRRDGGGWSLHVGSSSAQRIACNAFVIAERPSYIGGAPEWVRNAMGALGDTILVAPALIRSARTLRQCGDPRRLLASLSSSGPEPRPTAERELRLVRRIERGTRWLFRLFRPWRGSRCVLRSLAMYTWLRQRGIPVRFVSGVRRDGEQVVGHAWVELDGRVLPQLNEPFNRSIYAVGFCYPT